MNVSLTHETAGCTHGDAFVGLLKAEVKLCLLLKIVDKVCMSMLTSRGSQIDSMQCVRCCFCSRLILERI